MKCPKYLIDKIQIVQSVNDKETRQIGNLVIDRCETVKGNRKYCFMRNLKYLINCQMN